MFLFHPVPELSGQSFALFPSHRLVLSEHCLWPWLAVLESALGSRSKYFTTEDGREYIHRDFLSHHTHSEPVDVKPEPACPPLVHPSEMSTVTPVKSEYHPDILTTLPLVSDHPAHLQLPEHQFMDRSVPSTSRASAFPVPILPPPPMPLVQHAYTSPSDIAGRNPSAKGFGMQRSTASHVPSTPNNFPVFAQPLSSMPVNRGAAHSKTPSPPFGSSSSSNLSSSSLNSSSSSVTTVANDAAELSLLDRALESINVASLERVPGPACLISELHPHQEQALGWMLNREEGLQLSKTQKNFFFWHMQKGPVGKPYYRHSLTGKVCSEPPALGFGGLLCDDMGLGKTLTVIALMGKTRQKGRTLIVCPLSLLSNWVDQIEEHVADGTFRVYVYHGPDRDAKQMAAADVVVTTYGCLVTDWRQYGDVEASSSMVDDADVDYSASSRPTKKLRIDTRVRSLFHADLFYRVVFDEAHLCKSPGSLTSRAAAAVPATQRWCLTGTPIVNCLHDLFALIRAVHAEPLNDYARWKNLVSKPMREGKPEGFKRLRTIVKALCLRRVKNRPNATNAGQVHNIVSLPQLVILERMVELNEHERAAYSVMFDETRSSVEQAMEMREQGWFMHVLALLMRLRQVCNSPDLLPTRADIELICGLCEDPIDVRHARKTVCGHVFCEACILEWLEDEENRRCPTCKARCPPQSLRNYTLPEPSHVNTAPMSVNMSSKMQAIVDDLTQVIPSNEKSVLFSQWTSYLDLLEGALSAVGIPYVRLDGTMNKQTRDDAVRRFQRTPASECRVFLISLHAGGFGLNLTAAAHVAICDPWFNIETQAMDRAWRIGNKSPTVTVRRYICSRTIEERMLLLQTHKLWVTRSAFGARDGEEDSPVEELQALRQRAVRLLFQSEKSAKDFL